ncbi:hypothetical protein Tco_1185298 [Tanacetum coccineum]
MKVVQIIIWYLDSGCSKLDLEEGMAPVRISSGPEPIMMTPGQLNSGLAPSPIPATTYIPPTDKDLEILFQPMFDEYFDQSTDSRTIPWILELTLQLFLQIHLFLQRLLKMHLLQVIHCHPYKHPSSPLLSTRTEDLMGIPVDQTRFRGIVGSLMYLTAVAVQTLLMQMRIMRDVRIQEEVRQEVLSFLEIDWSAGHQRSKEARPSQQQRRNTLQCLDVVLNPLDEIQLQTLWLWLFCSIRKPLPSDAMHNPSQDISSFLLKEILSHLSRKSNMQSTVSLTPNTSSDMKDHLKMEMEMEIPSSSNVKLMTECTDTTYTCYEVMKDLNKGVKANRKLDYHILIHKSGDDANKHINIGSSSELNLSFGDTLYLHPNDTSGSPIMTIKLNDLKDTYDKVDGSAVFNLHKNINSLTQNGASLVEYYNNLKSLWKQFDAMVSLPPYTYEAAKHFEQHNQLIKLMQFLMGLDESYLAIRSNILTREPLPLVKAAFAVVSGEKSHRNATYIAATKPTTTAFVTKTFDNKRRCFELVGYPASYVKKNFNANTRPVSSNNASDPADVHSNNVSSNNATTSNSHVFLSNEQLARLMSILNDNDISTSNANMATKFFKTLKELFNEYTISLLSVQKLARDSKLFVGFDESNCYIQDLRAKGTIGIGNQCNGLYSFNVNNASKIVFNNCNSSNFVSKTLWHQRLGYSADQVLDVLKTTLNIDSHSTSDHLWELPLYLWSESILVTVYIINMIPSSVLSGKSPFSFVFRDDPSLSHFRDFSCLCYATILNNQDKFSSRPNDEGGVSSNGDGIELSPEFQGNDDSEATSMEENNNTHLEGNVSNETDFVNDFYENSEFNSKVEELLVNTQYFKYGVEKVVNYDNLSHENFCFASSLNKSVEPSCYKDAILDNNWVDATNAKIEALNKNQT